MHDLDIAPKSARKRKINRGFDSAAVHAYELATKRIAKFKDQYEPLLRSMCHFSLRTRCDKARTSV